jgi:hypothetical protein
MDIAGAKALKKRLGPNATDGAPPVSAHVREDAPPVYHWLGVSDAPTEGSSAEADDTPSAEGASLFSRLGLSFR